MGECSFFYAGIFHVLVIKTSSVLITAAGMNYYLAVIPFLGAVEAGLFGQLQYEIEILPPEERRDDFCYSVADCRSRIPKLMDKWKAYFEVNNFTSFFFFIFCRTLYQNINFKNYHYCYLYDSESLVGFE